MDKKDWKESLKNLNDLLKVKSAEFEKQRKDLEEIKYTIKCYEKKIETFK